MTQVTAEELTEIGEEILDDEGQVELSVRIDDGRMHDAQVYLLGAIDGLMNRQRLTPSEVKTLIARLKLPMRDIERLRGENVEKFR